MAVDFDLDAYFQRIGYSGSPAANLETLTAIHLQHPQSIPFENLNPLLRWPVRLDVQSLQHKLVRERRGGYCFEQNLLLSHALRQLGFRVKGLAARVLWNAPEGTVTPRGHMLLLIDLDGHPFLADVGFGGVTLTSPMRLQVGVEQHTPHETFRLSESGDAFLMEAKIGSVWRPLYRFDLQEHLLPDYEVTSWYLSNHPSSHFVTGLIAARPDLDRRYALRNNELAVHHMNGATDRQVMTSAAALRATLENTFRVAVPDGPELQAALERVVARAA